MESALPENKKRQLAGLLSSLRESIQKKIIWEESTLPMNTLVTNGVSYNAPVHDEELHINLRQANEQYHTAKWLPDHRFALGRPLMKKIIYRIMGFYTARQTNFNAVVVRILNSLAGKVSDADQRVEQVRAQVDRIAFDIDERFNRLTRELQERFNFMELTQNRLVTRAKADIENRVMEVVRATPTAASSVEKRSEPARRDLASRTRAESPVHTNSFGTNYFCFADKFRGDETEIKNQLAAHLEYFRRCKNVVDLGCGRGEFLELCEENKINALGVDTNDDMVLYCQRKGLQVHRADARAYLRSLPEKHLDGIFTAYLAEHMPPAEFAELLHLAYEKLQFGSHFVAEAINPACLSTLADNFYLDLLHVKPIHPQAFEFMLESLGFRNIKINYVTPVPEEERLRKLNSIRDNLDQIERQRIEMYNQNVDKLNELLFGYQAYAIVARK
jgi:O-antigen chain-terminating methyltransferase